MQDRRAGCEREHDITAMRNPGDIKKSLSPVGAVYVRAPSVVIEPCMVLIRNIVRGH
jgi:hypothetical protein